MHPVGKARATTEPDKLASCQEYAPLEQDPSGNLVLGGPSPGFGRVGEGGKTEAAADEERSPGGVKKCGGVACGHQRLIVRRCLGFGEECRCGFQSSRQPSAEKKALAGRRFLWGQSPDAKGAHATVRPSGRRFGRTASGTLAYGGGVKRRDAGSVPRRYVTKEDGRSEDTPLQAAGPVG